MWARVFFRYVWPGSLLLCAAAPSLALACPNCKDGMGNDPNGANLISGYFWSICFMMSMPYLIFCALATYLYLEVRKARRFKAAEQARQQAKAVALAEVTSEELNAATVS